MENLALKTGDKYRIQNFSAIGNSIKPKKSTEDFGIFDTQNKTQSTFCGAGDKKQIELYDSICKNSIDAVKSCGMNINNHLPTVMNPAIYTVVMDCANNVLNKNKEIQNSYNQVMHHYLNSEINSILNNKDLSESEREKQISAVLEKMEKTREEALKKVDILTDLMKTYSKIAQNTLKMKDLEKNFESLTALKDVVVSLNSEPTDFDEKSITEKFKENNNKTRLVQYGAEGFGKSSNEIKSKEITINDKNGGNIKFLGLLTHRKNNLCF